MPGTRYVLLGLAAPRSAWFGDLARWTTSGAFAAEFVKSMAVEELRARLTSGRRFSAVLVEPSVPGWDRDAAELAGRCGCAVILVGEARPAAGGAGAGGAGAGGAGTVGGDGTPLLPPDFTLDQLTAVLGAVAQPVPRADDPAAVDPRLRGPEPAPAVPGPPGTPGTPSSGQWQGRLIAVTGAGGSGRSTLARAVAAGLADDPRDRGLVLLADLALNAQQHLLHDTGDVVPGVAELVDAHRRSDLGPAEVRRLCYEGGPLGYDVLLGLRRQRDWAALQPTALRSALQSLRGAYRLLVADVDADVEGVAECGLAEVEERNQLARTSLAQADLVVVVGRAGLAGLHAQLRVLVDLLQLGVAGDRLLPVMNLAPRSPRRRAAAGAALARLLGEARPGARLAANLVFVPERRRLDDILADGGRVPTGITEPLAGAVRAALDRVPDRSTGPAPAGAGQPVAVAPGSLGTWSDTRPGREN